MGAPESLRGWCPCGRRQTGWQSRRGMVSAPVSVLIWPWPALPGLPVNAGFLLRHGELLGVLEPWGSQRPIIITAALAWLWDNAASQSHQKGSAPRTAHSPCTPAHRPAPTAGPSGCPQHLQRQHAAGTPPRTSRSRAPGRVNHRQGDCLHGRGGVPRITSAPRRPYAQ